MNASAAGIKRDAMKTALRVAKVQPVGATAGFLVFNFHPASIFLGETLRVQLLLDSTSELVQIAWTLGSQQ